MYFWPPLWNYCCKVAPSICSRVGHGKHNHDDGLDAEDSIALAEILRKEIESGCTTAYAVAYQSMLDAVPHETCKICDGLGYSSVRRLRTRYGGETEYYIDREPCKSCFGSGKVRSWVRYFPFKIEEVEHFVPFLENCGGFDGNGDLHEWGKIPNRPTYRTSTHYVRNGVLFFVLLYGFSGLVWGITRGINKISELRHPEWASINKIGLEAIDIMHEQKQCSLVLKGGTIWRDVRITGVNFNPFVDHNGTVVVFVPDPRDLIHPDIVRFEISQIQEIRSSTPQQPMETPAANRPRNLPVPEDLPYADFSTPSIQTRQMQIQTAAAFNFNGQSSGCWRITAPGGGFNGTFNLPTDGLYSLVVTHLTSLVPNCPGQGYSPVSIQVNGQTVAAGYDPSAHHGGTHGLVTDKWSFTAHSGQNSIRITTGPLCSFYWIQKVEIRQ